MKNKKISLDSITTLEEAKKQIALLLDVQEKAHLFLHYLCNYDIRTPLLAIIGYTKLIQKGELTTEHPLFLKNMMNAELRIQQRINAVRDAIYRISEKGEEEKYYYHLETINLKPFLIEGKSEIQNIIDIRNENLANSLNSAEEYQKENSPKPIQFQAEILENIPTVQFNSEILKEIFSDIIFFITGDEWSISDLFMHSTFDDDVVKIVFGYTTLSSPDTRILEDFQRFETALSIFEFHSASFCLYRSWDWLKTYNGNLLLDLQDKKEGQQHSILTVTICLKR